MMMAIFWKENCRAVCLTFDVEDYFQVENLREAFPLESWDDQELRVEMNVKKLLDLLDIHDVKATFFVLGWIAERVPSMVREIADRGHEIASHGYSHKLNFQRVLGGKNLREDILRSKEILEEISGKRIIGYRAPSFSVSDELLFLLRDLDFIYDSSYCPFSLNPRYGRLSGYDDVTKPFVHDSTIWEIPIPLTNFCNRGIPIGGGGYFRLFPFFLYEWFVREYIVKNGIFIFYLHPWEIDPGQPRARLIRWQQGFRHYVNLGRTLMKLDRLITSLNRDDCIDFFTIAQCGRMKGLC